MIGMKLFKLDKMIKGWFVGNFEPTIVKTSALEVAVKEYRKGDYEHRHHHKIATEITVISKGKVLMNGREYNEGEIIVIEPGEATDFEALQDTTTTVVKLPCVKDDKYIV